MTPYFHQVRAAAISMRPVKWDKVANADRMEAYFAKAAKGGAQVVVGPEGMLDGYVVNEIAGDAHRTRDYLDLAEPIDGRYIRRFEKLAQQLKMCLVFGFAQRVRRRVCNTAIFIDQRGRIRGEYRKLTGLGEMRACPLQQPGRQIRAFDTPLGRAGIIICSDRWQPRIAGTLALDGAQILFVSAFGNHTIKQDRAVLARARETGLPIVEANVGVNLIISRGEIVTRCRKDGRITFGAIDVPPPRTQPSARAAERQFIRRRDEAIRLNERLTPEA